MSGPVRRLVHLPWRSTRRIAADVDDELRFHLEMREQALVAQGATPAAARAQALHEFGDLEEARRDLRRMDAHTEAALRRRNYMSELRSDVGYAFRQLRAAPLFTLVAVLTLALGIGATSAIFSVVNGVLLRPLPYPHPEQLVRAWVMETENGANARRPVSPPDLDDWRARRRVLADMGGSYYGAGSGVDLTGAGEPQRLTAAFVTPGFWTTLGVNPFLGRVPRDAEMVRGANDKLVVLSQGFWRRQFGGAASVLGQHIMLGGTSHEVVGVMPARFDFPAPDVDLWIPYSTIPDDAIPRERYNRILDVVGRLAPGATPEQAESELKGIARSLSEEQELDRGFASAAVAPLRQAMVGNVRTGLLVLLGAVGFVLLIAAVNLAGLLLARAATREREFAIRVALGAARGRLVRQLLTESLVLAIVGGALGVAVAWLGQRVLTHLAGAQLPRSENVGLDARVLAFTLGISVLTGIVFGLVPALRSASPDPQQALREGTRGNTRGGGTLRSALVVTEVALAMMLVVGAGLMGRSFAKLLAVDLGFAPEHSITVGFSLSFDRHPAPGEPQRVYRDILDRVRALPGVVAAGGVRDLPFHGDGEARPILVPGASPGPGGELPKATVMFASDGFFSAMGIPLLAGRDFTPQDTRTSPFVFVVNQAFAKKFFPGENPVGKTFSFGDTARLQIVGLVGDVKQGSVDETPAPRFYQSPFQQMRGRVNLVVRTREDPAVMTRRVIEAIRTVDPEQTISRTMTLDQAVGEAVARPRFLAVLLGLFGVMGLVLGALGIYGVLAYLVNQRAREIGVRLALGATPRDVLGMVLGRGLRLAVLGVVIGGAGAMLLTRVMQGVLFGVTPTDPLTFAGVALALLGVAAFASWLPALRATRVDPLAAIRAE